MKIDNTLILNSQFQFFCFDVPLMSRVPQLEDFDKIEQIGVTK